MARPVVLPNDLTPSFGIPWPKEFKYTKKDGIIWQLSDDEIRKTLKLSSGNPKRKRFEALLALKEQQPRLQDIDPVENGWILPTWERVNELWAETDIFVFFGGSRCLGKDALVYDPVARTQTPVSEIKGDFHVESWDGEKTVVAKANKPFLKGLGEILEVALSNGRCLSVSGNHLVLTPSGYRSISSLQVGDYVCRVPSISGNDPSTRVSDGRRWLRIVEDSQSDCPSLSYSCGGQLPKASSISQGVSPSQVGVLRPPFFSYPSSCSAMPYTDGRGNRCGYIQPWLAFGLPSIRGGLLHFCGLVRTLYRAFCRLCKSVCGLHESQEFVSDARQSCFETSVQPPPSGGVLSEDNQSHHVSAYPYNVLAVTGVKEKSKKDEIWDFEVPEYHNYIYGESVHHNSSKTTLAMRIAIWLCREIPGCVVRCFHKSKDRSIEVHHNIIFENLRAEEQALSDTYSRDFNFCFREGDGFPKNYVKFPKQPGDKTSSIIYLANYRQWFLDRQNFEGTWAHLWVFDEDVPQPLFETGNGRLSDVNGKIFLPYTTLSGWTSLVMDIMHGAKTTKTRYAEHEKKTLPYEQIGANWDKCQVQYFWSEDNPFFDHEDLYRRFAHRPIEIRLARFYGIPTKTFYPVFSIFSKKSHVIEHEEIPFIKDPETPVTRYMIADPGANKNWSIIWVGATKPEKAGWEVKPNLWVYDEWPDSPYGPWALPHVNAAGIPVGRAGPAQQDRIQLSPEEKIKMFLDRESGDTIFERIIDARAGATKRETSMGIETIIQQYANQGFIFRPAKVLGKGEKEILIGIEKIDDFLYYDKEKPLKDGNWPHIRVSNRCENMIYMFENFANCSRTEACKDYFDVIHYAVTTGLDFISDGYAEVTGGHVY